MATYEYVAELDKKNDELQKKNDSLENLVDNLTLENSDLKADLVNCQNTLTDQNEEKQKHTEVIANQNQQLVQKHVEIVELREQIAQMNAPQVPPARDHKCQICEKAFIESKGLKKHYTQVHENFCRICMQLFPILPDDVQQRIHNRNFTLGPMKRRQRQKLRHDETCGQ